ncbi:MAG TPA: hypothetical protein VEC99_02210 [Clostridia bacterium]|nr:hypothetical protein [Clostridia bacterium]
MQDTPLRATGLAIAAFALVLFALCELGLLYPVAWWLYLPVAMVFVVTLVRIAPLRSQRLRIGVLIAILGAIAALYFVNWTSRKPFLRDLARVRVGMTEAEVRQIMGRYMVGTGWPLPPFDASTSATGTTVRMNGSSQYSGEASSTGELALRDALVFRHSNDGAFNSDWGIISVSNGRVAKVEFSAD